MILVALVASFSVAAGSFLMGRQWAIRDVHQRLASMRQTLSESSFPLTANVVSSLARLTNTELLTLSRDGDVVESSLEVPGDWMPAREWFLRPSANGYETSVASTRFLLFRCQPGPGWSRRDLGHILILFDLADVQSASRRAAVSPLLAGISTIALLGSVLLLLGGRMVRRLENLEQHVSVVAEGNFDASCGDQSTDEIGNLGRAVDSMANQLNVLLAEVAKRQSEKLLHQLAGGMAHQLRNTLTGCKMALELHVRNATDAESEELEVALSELNHAEEYVRRLLLVGKGQLEEARPSGVLDCLQNLRSSMNTIAAHLCKQIEWRLDDRELTPWIVADGQSFSSAVSNLVLNAMQAAQEVVVVGKMLEQTDSRKRSAGNARTLSVRVIDDGPGIDASIRSNVFEPFVTTKPEGIGLGLATVQLSAVQLQGGIEWCREQESTIFEFTCRCTRDESHGD